MCQDRWIPRPIVSTSRGWYAYVLELNKEFRVLLCQWPWRRLWFLFRSTNGCHERRTLTETRMIVCLLSTREQAQFQNKYYIIFCLLSQILKEQNWLVKIDSAIFRFNMIFSYCVIYIYLSSKFQNFSSSYIIYSNRMMHIYMCHGNLLLYVINKI